MALKLRAKVNFPATVVGAGGIVVSKSLGVWTVQPDFSNITAVAASAVIDPSQKELWIYDRSTGLTNALTLNGLGDALYVLTSTTSVAVGSGSKTFATQLAKDISAGGFVLITSDAAPATNYMHGQVTSYAAGSLVVNVTTVGGSGTHTDWTIRASSPVGPQGPTGEGGATSISGTPTANQFATFSNATTIQAVSITGIVKGNGASAPAAATAGSDYVAPGTSTSFTAQQSFTLATLTDATSIAWDVSTRQKAKVTLGGNRTMAAVTNAVEGTTYLLIPIQDATGSRTLAYTTTGAGSFDFGFDGAPTLTTTASKADILAFEAISIAGTLKLRFLGIKKAFA